MKHSHSMKGTLKCFISMRDLSLLETSCSSIPFYCCCVSCRVHNSLHYSLRWYVILILFSFHSNTNRTTVKMQRGDTTVVRERRWPGERGCKNEGGSAGDDKGRQWFISVGRERRRRCTWRWRPVVMRGGAAPSEEREGLGGPVRGRRGWLWLRAWRGEEFSYKFASR